MLFTTKQEGIYSECQSASSLDQVHWSVSLAEGGEEARCLGLRVGGGVWWGEVVMGRAKKTFTATSWSPGATEGHGSGDWSVQLLTLAPGLRSVSLQAALLS